MVTSGGAVKLTGNQAVKFPLGKANGLARIHVNKKTFITSPEENAEKISSFIFMGMELSLDVDKHKVERGGRLSHMSHAQ